MTPHMTPGMGPIGPQLRVLLTQLALVIAADVAPLSGDLAISTVTLAERHFGVMLADDPPTRAERLRRLSILQRRFDALLVDDAVAPSYGTLAAAIAAADSRRRRAAWTCSSPTAHAHEARLHTRNAADLAGIREVVTA